MDLNKILEVTVTLETEIAAIKTEVEGSQAKGTFSYARAKAIRKSALEIAKCAKDLRVITLDTFKAQKGE
jgi:hypothetical protein